MEPGSRKTSVAVGDVSQTLLIAFEIGYKFIPNVLAAPVSSWVQFKQIIEALRTVEAKDKYKSIAIDTVGLAYQACVAYICGSKGVAEIGQIPYGQGWSLVKNEFQRTLHLIPQLGYGLTLIAHSDEMNDEKYGITAKVDLDKRPSAVIKGLADFILYTRKEENEKGEQTVYAYSKTPAKIEVKSRARFFPARIEFTYENLLAALEFAVEEQNKFFNTKSLDKPDFSAYQNEDQVNLENLQKEVIELGELLLETHLRDTAIEAIKESLGDVRVSETTKYHIPKLYALKDLLTEMKKGL